MTGIVQPGRRGAPTGATPDADASRRLDLAIARILQWGIGASVAFLAVGVVLMFRDGISPLEPAFPPFDPRTIIGDLLALEPAGYLWVGLALTIATPSLRVAASLVGYAREGDRRMALVAVSILIVIALSVVVAGAQVA